MGRLERGAPFFFLPRSRSPLLIRRRVRIIARLHNTLLLRLTRRPSMTPKSLVMAAFVLVTIGASACGGGDKSTGPGTLAGTYDLQSINGIAPPVTIYQEGTFKVEVTDAGITMNADNTFVGSTTIRESDVGGSSSSSTVCLGTYTRNGNSITFIEPSSSTDDCGGSYGGTWSNGNTLTITVAPGLQ